jgi:hypothetical protein
MGKKQRDVLDAELVRFTAGMQERGFSGSAITTLWDLLVPFSNYAFNKAHSAAYGLVSYWTAYLKANYPAEYMAALLTSTRDDKDKSAIYLNECRRMGISVLPPDVNESESTFTPVGRDIRFGLSAVRNVGGNVVDAIVAARSGRGKFVDFVDFMDKVPALVCNKRLIESLAKSGAFDSLGHRRRAVVAVHEEAVDQYVDVKRNEAMGQESLFGGVDDDTGFSGLTVVVPQLEEWDKQTLLGFEREMLGLYVSDHPLLGLENVLSAASDCTVGQLLADDERAEGSTVVVAGLVTSVQRKLTKKGATWAVVTVEDLEGGIEVMCFPRHLSAGRAAAGGGLDRGGEGPGQAPRRRRRAARDRHQGPRHDAHGSRSGGHHAAGCPVQPPYGRAAEGCAGHPSRCHRGAATAAGPCLHHADASGQPAARHADTGPDGGSEGAARPPVPRSVSSRGTGLALAVPTLALGLAGLLGGLIWAWWADPATYMAVPGGAALGQEQLGRLFAVEVRYAVVGARRRLRGGGAPGGAAALGRAATDPRSSAGIGGGWRLGLRRRRPGRPWRPCHRRPR